MKRITSIALLSLIVTTSLCSVAPKNGLPHAQLIQGDVWSRTLANNIFDTSKGIFPVQFKSTGGGQTFNADQYFTSKHYGILQVKELNFVQVIDENLAAAVFDDTHVIFQLINHNGLGFGDYIHIDLKTFGSNYFCSDFAVNRNRFLVYIGCFDKTSSEASPGSMAIHTFDFNTRNVTSSAVVKQDDGFRIINRLTMFVHEFPQGSNDDSYLFVYDQGHTSQNETRQVPMARIFHNVNSGVLSFDTVVNTQMEGRNFDVIYDYFPWNGTLIIASRITDIGEIITLAQCKLDLTDDIIHCNPKLKATALQHGKAILHEKGWYTEIDIAQKQFRVYRIHGDFSSHDWNSELVRRMENIVFPDGQEDSIWIRNAVTNEWSSAIQYGRRNHTDPGSTFMDWTSGKNNFYWGDVADIYDRDWFVGTTKNQDPQVSLLRNDVVYVVDSHYLKTGNNQLTVTAFDSQNQATVSNNFILLKSIFERIYIKNQIGIIELNSHQTLDIRITEEEIIWGNGINVRIESDDEKVVTGMGVTHHPVRLIFNGTDISSGDYYFTGHRALIRSNIGRLIWTRCSRTAIRPLTYTCIEDGAHPISSGERLMSKVMARGEVLMAASTNKTSSTVYFMTNDGELVQHGFDNEFFRDFAFLETNTFLYVILAFDDRVDIYSLNRFDIQEFDFYHSFNVNNTAYDNFCPRKVEVPPGSQDEFDILSSCGNGFSSYILRWGLTHNTPHMGIPLDSRTHPSEFCSFGNEFMIRGHDELYAISNSDDFSRFNVPLSDLDASINFDTYCIRELGQFVVLGHSHSGKNYTISVINGNEGAQQAKRYPTVIEGFEAEDIKSFDFMGRPLHVVENAQERRFFVTLRTPILRFTAGNVEEETDVPVKITFYNKQTEQTFYQFVTVFPHD